MAVLSFEALLCFANLTGGWSCSLAVSITPNLNVNMDAAAANRVQRVGEAHNPTVYLLIKYMYVCK
jgi:hypothetical protein